MAAAVVGDSETVLVVDDEEAVLSLTQQMLEVLGFTVLTAVSGRQGVEIFRAQRDRIRLVLLDMTMPQLDGEGTLREIRHIRSDVPAILTSGYDEEAATRRFAGTGLAAFIQKPYRLEDLMSVVGKALAPGQAS